MRTHEIKDIPGYSMRSVVKSFQLLWKSARDRGREAEQKPDQLARVRHLTNELNRGRGHNWNGPGVVRVVRDKLLFITDAGTSRTSRSTIEAVERNGHELWVRRRRAHDWYIRFEDADDAARIETDIRTALGNRNLGELS